MTTQELILIGLLLSLIAYVMTLYHLAHGKESAAIELGARIVIDALTADGRIAPVSATTPTNEAVNIGEEDYEISSEDPALPSIIVARNTRAAEQMGDKINDDLMRFMDEKI